MITAPYAEAELRTELAIFWPDALHSWATTSPDMMPLFEPSGRASAVDYLEATPLSWMLAQLPTSPLE